MKCEKEYQILKNMIFEKSDTKENKEKVENHLNSKPSNKINTNKNHP